MPSSGMLNASMMRSDRALLPLLAILMVTGTLTAFPQDAGADDESINYFETHVRPVLATHCYQCHSREAEKLKASLYLDSKAGILKGGDNGGVIIPGKAEESLLIKAVGYQVVYLEMPPKKKLPDSAVT
ncbi:MAG: c-type cytochrome domain-containing protein, partial [Verrucomicrobiota bacterium]|nr:c-type cytochrome domain-containing protein [Verrucomicrobiota bacterium]